MVISHRPVAQSRSARSDRRLRPVARFLAVAMLGALSYAGLTGMALAPASDLLDTTPAPIQLALASLSYSGVDPVITGSVDSLFAAAGFTGPNRAAKTDRMRPPVDVLALSRSFEEA